MHPNIIYLLETTIVAAVAARGALSRVPLRLEEDFLVNKVGCPAGSLWEGVPVPRLILYGPTWVVQEQPRNTTVSMSRVHGIFHMHDLVSKLHSYSFKTALSESSAYHGN